MWEGPPPPVMLGNGIEQFCHDYQPCVEKVDPCEHEFGKRIIIGAPTVYYYFSELQSIL